MLVVQGPPKAMDKEVKQAIIMEAIKGFVKPEEEKKTPEDLKGLVKVYKEKYNPIYQHIESLNDPKVIAKLNKEFS